MKDSYGPIHRAHMQHEIEREDEMLRKAKRWWWHRREDIGELGLLFIGIAIVLAAVVVYGTWPR